MTVVQVKSSHGRTKGIEEDVCLVSLVSAMLLHSCVIAIGSVMHWIAHLQCYVLAMHSAVVKVQSGQYVQGKT